MGQKAYLGARVERQSEKRSIPRRALVALLILVVGVLLSRVALNQSQPVGTLLAASTRFNAGKVRMGDGLVHATFPLTVQGDLRIAEIRSS